MLPQRSRKIQSGAPVEGAQRDVLARLGCTLAQWARLPEQNTSAMVPRVGFALDSRQIVEGSDVRQARGRARF